MNPEEAAPEGRFDRALTLLAVLVPPAILGWAIASFAVNMLIYDDWRWADMVLKFDAGHLTFADLWHQNNEHRLLLPSLIALGLSRLGGYNTVRESFFSLACALATLACINVLLRRSLPSRAVPWILLIESILLFSLNQLENFMWGFQIAWILIDFLLFVMVVALTGRRLSAFECTSGLGAMIAACISSAQGLSLIPIGLLLLVVRRPVPLRYAALWTVAGIVTAVTYFWGMNYNAPQYAEPHMPANPLVRIPIFLVFMGTPMARWAGNAGAIAAGSVVTLLALAALLRFAALVRARSPDVERWVPWIAPTLFGLGGGMMVSFGRSGLGFDFVRAERYETLASMTLLGLVPLAVLAVCEAPRGEGRRRAALAACALGVLLAIPFAVEYSTAIAFGRYEHAALLEQQAMVRNYRQYDDATLIPALFPFAKVRAVMRANNFPSPEDARSLIEGMEAHHEGPFAGLGP